MSTAVLAFPDVANGRLKFRMPEPVFRFSVCLIIAATIVLPCAFIQFAYVSYVADRWMQKRVTEEADFKEREMYVFSKCVNGGWPADLAMSVAAAMWLAHDIDLRRGLESDAR